MANELTTEGFALGCGGVGLRLIEGLNDGDMPEGIELLDGLPLGFSVGYPLGSVEGAADFDGAVEGALVTSASYSVHCATTSTPNSQCALSLRCLELPEFPAGQLVPLAINAVNASA